MADEMKMDKEQLRERLSTFKGKYKKSEALLKTRASERQQEITEAEKAHATEITEAEKAHAIELSKERTLKEEAQKRARTLKENLDEANEGCAKAEHENEKLRGENEELRNENEKLRSKPLKRKVKHEDEEYSPPPKTLKKSTNGHFIIIPRGNEFKHKGGQTYTHSVHPDTYIKRYNDGDIEFASRVPFESTTRVHLLNFSYRCVLT